jgi:hypothetical protein
MKKTETPRKTLAKLLYLYEVHDAFGAHRAEYGIEESSPSSRPPDHRDGDCRKPCKLRCDDPGRTRQESGKYLRCLPEPLQSHARRSIGMPKELRGQSMSRAMSPDHF